MTITSDDGSITLNRKVGDEIGVLPIQRRDGYKFDHCEWEGRPIDGTKIIPPDGMNFIPIWVKDVWSEENDGTVEIRFWNDNRKINTIDLYPGDTLYDPGAPETVEIEDRVFLRWSLEPGGEGYTLGRKIEESLDLYVVWAQ